MANRLTHRKLMAELEKIRAAHDGVLHPVDVVESASDPASPLHDSFEWDDTEAGRQWRLAQARQLIRVAVIVRDGTEPEKIRAFVSLSPDRSEGGGYRPIDDVLSDEALKFQLLRDASIALANFQRRYRQLTELAKVTGAIDEFLQSQTPSNDQAAA